MRSKTSALTSSYSQDKSKMRRMTSKNNYTCVHKYLEQLLYINLLYLVFSQGSNNQRTNHSRQRSHPVRNAHQDAGIARSNVQMIDIKT